VDAHFAQVLRDLVQIGCLVAGGHRLADFDVALDNELAFNHKEIAKSFVPKVKSLCEATVI
jgi:hypothetical protein